MIFDEKYDELKETMDPAMRADEKLLYMNHQLFAMIDEGISVELLGRLFSTQITTRGEKHLLNRNRTYFKLLQQIVRSGQEKGELRRDMPSSQIINDYALFERAIMYDWCLAGGEYALAQQGDRLMPMLIRSYLPDQK